MKSVFKSIVALAITLFLTWSPSVSACAVCFGAKDSAMTHGMNSGILFLLGIVGFMILSFSSFFGYLWWRSNHPLVGDRG